MLFKTQQYDDKISDTKNKHNILYKLFFGFTNFQSKDFLKFKNQSGKASSVMKPPQSFMFEE